MSREDRGRIVALTIYLASRHAGKRKEQRSNAILTFVVVGAGARRSLGGVNAVDAGPQGANSCCLSDCRHAQCSCGCLKQHRLFRNAGRRVGTDAGGRNDAAEASHGAAASGPEPRPDRTRPWPASATGRPHEITDCCRVVGRCRETPEMRVRCRSGWWSMDADGPAP